jgi:hypothetical protein
MHQTLPVHCAIFQRHQQLGAKQSGWLCVGLLSKGPTELHEKVVVQHSNRSVLRGLKRPMSNDSVLNDLHNTACL